MRRNRKAVVIGTISHGTLRNEDLLDSFAGELDRIAKARDKWARHLIRDARKIDPDSDDANEVIEALGDHLNNYALPYTFFGSHDGDGSDFGFWPSIEALEYDASIGDVLKVSDTSEVPRAYRGFVMHVNDHGNVTLYRAISRGLREIWGCV